MFNFFIYDTFVWVTIAPTNPPFDYRANSSSFCTTSIRKGKKNPDFRRRPASHPLHHRAAPPHEGLHHPHSIESKRQNKETAFKAEIAPNFHYVSLRQRGWTKQTVSLTSVCALQKCAPSEGWGSNQGNPLISVYLLLFKLHGSDHAAGYFCTAARARVLLRTIPDLNADWL